MSSLMSQYRSTPTLLTWTEMLLRQLWPYVLKHRQPHCRGLSCPQLLLQPPTPQMPGSTPGNVLQLLESGKALWLLEAVQGLGRGAPSHQVCRYSQSAVCSVQGRYPTGMFDTFIWDWVQNYFKWISLKIFMLCLTFMGKSVCGIANENFPAWGLNHSMIDYLAFFSFSQLLSQMKK